MSKKGKSKSKTSKSRSVDKKMKVKMKTDRLRRLLEIASIARRGSGSPLVEAPMFKLEEDGVHVNHFDKLRSVYVHAVFSPSFFINYKEIDGDFSLGADTVLPLIRKGFQDIEEVDCQIKDDKFVVSCPSESYSEELVARTISPSQIEISEDETYGLVIKDLPITARILLDPAEFQKLPKADRYVFYATKKSFSIGIETEISRYGKTLQTEKNKVEKKTRTVFDATFVSTVFSLFEEKVWLHFGDNSPLYVYEGNEDYRVLFLIAPIKPKE